MLFCAEKGDQTLIDTFEVDEFFEEAQTNLSTHQSTPANTRITVNKLLDTPSDYYSHSQNNVSSIEEIKPQPFLISTSPRPTPCLTKESEEDLLQLSPVSERSGPFFQDEQIFYTVSV